MDRVVEAVDRTLRFADRFSVERLYAFATSAVRDATNGADVIERIHRQSNIRPQFLSGEDEARLTYLAVHSWYGWSSGRLLVLDIGGGSMEIVLGRDAKPDLAVSLPLGAGRLTAPSCRTIRRRASRSRLFAGTSETRYERCPTGCVGKGTRAVPSRPQKPTNSSPGSPVRQHSEKGRLSGVLSPRTTFAPRSTDWRPFPPKSARNCVVSHVPEPVRSSPGPWSPRRQ